MMGFLLSAAIHGFMNMGYLAMNKKLGLQRKKNQTTNIHEMLSSTILSSNAGSDFLLYQSSVLSEIFVKLSAPSERRKGNIC